LTDGTKSDLITGVNLSRKLGTDRVTVALLSGGIVIFLALSCWLCSKLGGDSTAKATAKSKTIQGKNNLSVSELENLIQKAILKKS